jgi:hypothetical protein
MTMPIDGNLDVPVANLRGGAAAGGAAVLHSSTDVIVARSFGPDLLPSWQQRLETHGRRLLNRGQPQPSEPEPDPPTGRSGNGTA